jgi:hypothetical protein
MFRITKYFFRISIISLVLAQGCFVLTIPAVFAAGNATNIGTDISTTGNLTVNGLLKFVSGAVDKYILATDSNGNATWTSVSSALNNAIGDASGVLTNDGFGNLSWVPASSPSQWTTVGSDIFYNAGQVGIGDNGFGANRIALNADGSASFANGALTLNNLGKINGSYLLPASDGTSGQVLTTNGVGAVSWNTSQGTPAGSSNQIQFNNSGAFGGSPAYVVDSSDSNASKMKAVSPNGTKIIQVAVDQLWNIGQVYTTANSMELWSNANKVLTLDGSQNAIFSGGITLNPTTSKPTCSASVRGTQWLTQGGAGVKDTLELCAKDASNAYAWRTIY